MPNRRSMRLRHYDYSQGGVYFVTICTYRFKHLFGQVVAGNVQLNHLGRLVKEEWLKTATVRPTVDVDLFVVMPNHLHGLLFISDSQVVRAPAGGATIRANSLGSIIAQVKSVVTKRSRSLTNPPTVPIWKRHYYDYKERSERALKRIRQYIIAKPSRWSEDEYFRE